MVPHDFSEPANHALTVAASLAAKHGGQVTVLHVLTPFYSGPGYPTQDEIAWKRPAEIAAERQRWLERIVRDRLKRRARLVTCQVARNEPLPAILKAAKSADSIVMATLGRTGLAHLLIGSVAAKVVRHAPIPVLTVRAPKPRRTRAKPRVRRRRRNGPTRSPRASLEAPQRDALTIEPW